MARKHAHVEFLNTLKDIYGFKRTNAFAHAYKKKKPNMVDYLSGTKRPTKKLLKSCLEKLNGWSVNPIEEINKIPNNLNSLPENAGIYILYNSGAQVVYVGKATNFRSEIRQTLKRKIPGHLHMAKKGGNLIKLQPKIGDIAKYVSLYEIQSEQVRHNFEALLLRGFSNQTHNSNIGHFK